MTVTSFLTALAMIVTHLSSDGASDHSDISSDCARNDSDSPQS